MPSTFITPRTGSPFELIERALSIVPGLRPQLVVNGVGALLELPDAFLPALQAVPGIVAVAAGALPSASPLPVAPEVLPWLRAFSRFHDPAHVAARSARPSSWHLDPGSCHAPRAGARAAEVAQPLTGDIAVGLITISGPAGSSAALKPEELFELPLAVLGAFNLLYAGAKTSPNSHLVFHVDIQHPTPLTLDPASLPAPLPTANGTFMDYESREAPWRDATLLALGMRRTGFLGIADYREKLLNQAWPLGARPGKSIVLLVTNYGAAWYGYASEGRVVAHYARAKAAYSFNDLDRMIAHEICHLFGVPANHPASDNPCLMSSTGDQLCPTGRAEVGWTSAAIPPGPLPLPLPPLPPLPPFPSFPFNAEEG